MDDEIKLWRCLIETKSKDGQREFFVIEHLKYPLLNHYEGMLGFQEFTENGEFLRWVYIPYSEIIELHCRQFEKENK